ncbi:hypothetical protein [Hirschia litorea]|uniref:Uncharacterized protein n=1 Tax=Hirschia litorea TaxID=1199156 RepID=A0ABW2IKE0_9PROT
MLDIILTNGLKGALLGGGLGLVGLPLAYLFVQLVDNPARQMVKTNFVVNTTFVFGAVFFGVLVAVPYAFDGLIDLNTQHGFAIVFFTISMACLLCLYDASKRQIEWMDDGIMIQRWNSAQEFYTWKQITAIEWDPVLHIWRMHLNDDNAFAIHPLMTGASRFLEIAIDKSNLFTQGKYSHLRG